MMAMMMFFPTAGVRGGGRKLAGQPEREAGALECLRVLGLWMCGTDDPSKQVLRNNNPPVPSGSIMI